ncbi:MAG: mycofactocin biosynthesis glycosyltransferase MftF [Firmicutes bacterium]|nr:mycofactocin biosynthesis glycosyltransferase MftF [Bacillota bacterium]
MFSFSLAEGYRLARDQDGWSIAGNLPKRRVTISAGLAQSLLLLFKGTAQELAWATQKSLFHLAAKGYINIKYSANTQNIATLPMVSVVIPVKNRAQDLKQCLSSLYELNWPPNKLQIIVVDDNSSDETPQIVQETSAILIKKNYCEGPAAARNLGVQKSSGDIIAFIDSDCLADSNWLNDLIPWFSFSAVGALGGLVEGYYQQTPLDKYESACSSLSLGQRFLFEKTLSGAFYVPGCNMLIRKKLFLQLGGFNPQMYVGEDVDLCWRLRRQGCALIYVPQGKIWHKHRTAAYNMLQRKFTYGTSEAALYKQNQDKKKILPLPLEALLFYLSAAAIIIGYWQFFCLLILAWITSAFSKHRLSKQVGLPVKAPEACRIAWRSNIAVSYSLSYHIIRYYLFFSILIACIWPKFVLLLLAALFFSSYVEWRIKNPRLPYTAFLFYYILEQLFYQAGVIWGGVKHGYFRFYLLRLHIWCPYK